MTPSRDRVLQITDLTVQFRTNDALVDAVRGLSLNIHAGECLGIVGESGSGKSQTFLAAMGLVPQTAVVCGRVVFRGQDLLALPKQALNKIRGQRVSMIFQDPLTSLTPHMRIGEQMREVLKTHQHMSDNEALEKCLLWLDKVRMPDARHRLDQYPHELSGGMRQRVMIAMAMLCEPDLLIADEPTTALDVTIQADILDIMNELRHDQGTAIALITHDMGVVARMCDRVQVMRRGLIVEEGDCDTIFYHPEHSYTTMLLEAVPRIPGLDRSSDTVKEAQENDLPAFDDESLRIGANTQSDILKVADLRVNFKLPTPWFAKKRLLRAVDGVGFSLRAGETIGIVGESGSGKSTLARAILQLLQPSSGSVHWRNRDLSVLSASELKQVRREWQIVFQDPMASLNPSLSIGESIVEPLKVCEPAMSARDRLREVISIMQRVGLDHSLINRYPHELSGGQNQRVGIARAMISKPQLLICDEAVSALDVSIQAQIVTLLQDLQQEFGLSILFISHDLSVVWSVSQRVLVMYQGAVVEFASRESLFARPQHPYTRQLLSAVLLPDPIVERTRKRIKLREDLALPMDADSRLRFLDSRRDLVSSDYAPALQERFDQHFVAEHDSLESLLLAQNTQ